jgi:hypothetical protein
MVRRVLVLTTSTAPDAGVEAAVRARAGDDAEIHVIAPASKISWFDRLANDEDAAREDAAERAQATAEAVPADNVEAHVGDVDPINAIEDALRMFPADEVIVFTAPEDQATWLEGDLGRRVNERIALPVTYLSTN